MRHHTSLADMKIKTCAEQVQYLKKRRKTSPGSFPTIFDVALNPDPSKGQFTPSDDALAADAVLMFGAGTDTTAHTLVVGTWHILNEPRILQTLNHELRQAMPNRDDTLDWATLENLPYLVRTHPIRLKPSSNVTRSELSSKKVFDSLTVRREDYHAWSLPPERLSAARQSHRGYVYYTNHPHRLASFGLR